MVRGLSLEFMSKQYYVKRAGRISGPFSGSEVKSGIKTGRLKEQDLISLSKDGPWRTLKGVFKKIRAAEKKLLLNVCEACRESNSPKSKICRHCGQPCSSHE